MAPDRSQAERRGRRAETAALLLLRLKGYRLLARRWHSPVGEVDLIMRKGATTAFIEVKQRLNHDAAVAAVSPRQARRIAAAAASWLGHDARAAAGACRFDIVTVSPYLWPRHIANAFDGDR
jgi:putative endonuclease